jgi:two-component system, OmpR family, response regulator
VPLRLLIIEDDDTVAAQVVTALTSRGHHVDRAECSEEGVRMASAGRYDVLVVDRMLPGGDGLDLIQEMRSKNDLTPALVLTALGSIGDRVKGLKGGADDYLVKPFSIDELEARIEVLARRAAADPVQIRIGNLSLDRLARTVHRGATRIFLRPREVNSPTVVTKKMLLEQVWGISFDPGTNPVESHVSRLRSQIDRGGDPPIIHTVRGQGYLAQAY